MEEFIRFVWGFFFTKVPYLWTELTKRLKIFFMYLILNILQYLNLVEVLN